MTAETEPETGKRFEISYEVHCDKFTMDCSGNTIAASRDLIVMEGIGKPDGWDKLGHRFYYESPYPSWHFGIEKFKIDPSSNKIQFVTFNPRSLDEDIKDIKDRIAWDISSARIRGLGEEIEKTEKSLEISNNDWHLNKLKCKIEVNKANFYNPFRKRINGEDSYDRILKEAVMYYMPLALASIVNPYMGLLSPAFILFGEANRRSSMRDSLQDYNSIKNYIDELKSKLTSLKGREMDCYNQTDDLTETPLEFIVCESAKQFVETFRQEKKAKPYFKLDVPKINEILLEHYKSELAEKHGLKIDQLVPSF